MRYFSFYYEDKLKFYYLILIFVEKYYSHYLLNFISLQWQLLKSVFFWRYSWKKGGGLWVKNLPIPQISFDSHN